MIGFPVQYDFLITVLRTSKEHLSQPISITVNEHQPEQQKKDEREIVMFHFIIDGSSCHTTGGKFVSVLTNHQPNILTSVNGP